MKLDTEQLGDFHIFSVTRKRGVSPRTGTPVEYHTLQTPDWVQVVPCTRAGQLVMVDQFRVGAEIASLEFPGGIIDLGESDQSAGLRELLEETGYRAEQITSIGHVYANPAIQNNRLFLVVAENCELAGPAQQDDGEDINVRLVEPADVPDLIRAGTIHHGLVVSAWLLYELWRVQRSASRT